jgi:hypothetical protein
MMRRLPLAIAALSSAVLFAACSGGTTTGPTAGTSMASLPSTGLANYGSSRPRFLRLLHTPAHPPPIKHRVTSAMIARSRAAGWQQLSSYPAFPNGPQTELLLTDGTVLVYDYCSSEVFKLTPDKNGNYLTGSWTQLASLPNSYAPLYFASAVLPDGKVIMNGGEYQECLGAEQNKGAIYDPVANTWTAVTAPTGWSEIGDGQSVVLSNGTYMLGNCCYETQAQYNEASSSWTLVGNGKQDTNSEEGWTLLPSGNVIDAEVFDAPYAQYYSPSANEWEAAGQTPVNLVTGDEIGPQTLRPDGTVWVPGATGYSATYNYKKNSWKQGPTFPVVGGSQLDTADAPSTLLIDGSVMVAASPGLYNSPATFFIYNGKKLKQITGPPNAPNDSSYNIRLLMLPTGQVLEDDGSNEIEIYSAKSRTVGQARPQISYVPTSLSPGSTYTAEGTLFNGLSQANFYGDDDQQATNFPLVRITNNSTGHVFYARTHSFSFMGVASKSTVSTDFDVPSTIETGASSLVVVCNGIASQPVTVTIQ